jgi:class 3 adenylate cyclase
VALIDAAAGEFEIAAIEGRGLDLDVRPGVRIPLGHGISARAVRTREAQLVLDVRADPDYVPDAQDVAAQLSVPLLWGEVVLGVLTVESVDPSILSKDVVERIKTVAEQIAGSVENARLYERLTGLFSRYVAPDLAEVLLTDPDRFYNRGERREASLLLVDVRGFTGLTQRLGGEQVLGLLNSFFREASGAVVEMRGSVNRYLGDGLLAVFGVPEAIDDHSDAALLAALAIHQRARALSAAWESVAGSPLRLTMVLHCGELVVGSLGDRVHADFTVLGDVVNVAARLEAEAKRLDVDLLMTTEMLAQLTASPVTRALGSVVLRGREGEVEVVEVLIGEAR